MPTATAIYTNVVNVIETRYRKRDNEYLIQMFDAATGEYSCATVVGGWKAPVEVNADADTLAAWKSRQDAQNAPLVEARKKAREEAEIAKFEAEAIELSLTHARVLRGKNAGKIGKVIAHRPSDYAPGLVYKLQRGTDIFFAGERDMARITEDDALAIARGDVNYCSRCGREIEAGDAMSASLGTVCSACYDLAENEL